MSASKKVFFFFLGGAAVGMLLGWGVRGLLPREIGGVVGGACHDEVISIESARGPASCTYPEAESQLKDSYLVCRCKKK